MSYIDQSLGANESVIARARFHWWYSFKAWAALILLFWCVIGVVVFFQMMIRKWTTEIGVTTTRFVAKTGLFTLHTNEIALPNIEGVRLEQSFWGRMLGYGHLRIEGTGVDAIVVPDIADPIGFRRAIETAKEGANRLPSQLPPAGQTGR
ncbi:MAG TPA: PH domain-containing protein [Rhizomicrobium sp.]|nr:PH domain-containing protein [Rhizomicrobium sp.]